MKNTLKQDIRQLGKPVMMTLWFLGEHAFVATLVLVAGAGLIAALLFYQYVIFFPQIEQEAVVSEFAFEEELFESILFELEQEKANVQNADSLTPRDLFNP